MIVFANGFPLISANPLGLAQREQSRYLSFGYFTEESEYHFDR